MEMTPIHELETLVSRAQEKFDRLREEYKVREEVGEELSQARHDSTNLRYRLRHMQAPKYTPMEQPVPHCKHCTQLLLKDPHNLYSARQ
jgi:hypothetical protein